MPPVFEPVPTGKAPLTTKEIRSLSDIAASVRSLCRMAEIALENPALCYGTAMQISEMIQQALLNVQQHLQEFQDEGVDRHSIELMRSLCDVLEPYNDLFSRKVIALSSLRSPLQ